MTDAVFITFETVAGALVNGFLISLVLVGLTAGILHLVGRVRSINASTRYGVWSLTLAAVLAAHVVGAGLMPGSVEPDSSQAVAEWNVSESPAAAQRATEAPAATQALAAENVEREPSQSGPDVVWSAEEMPAVAGAGTAGTSAAGDGESVSIPVSGGLFVLSALLILIWFSGAVAGVASIVSAWRRVRTLKSDARAIDPERWQRLLPTDLGRSFSVAQSSDVSSPVAAGLLHPMILIPDGLLDRLTDDEFRQVLLHEVAHIERFDDWTILAQRVGEALLWHHPAMWKVSRELQSEREIACDDWVVSLTRRPEAYVHSIGRMIELNLDTRSLRLAPGLAAERGDLMGRMRRLLNQKLPESSRLSGEQMAVAAGLTALVLVLVAVFVPMMRMAFSIGDGETMAYVFGESSDAVVQMQEIPPIEPLPPLAPIPPLPALPPLPPLPPLADFAEPAPPAPAASGFRMREAPPPPPMPAGFTGRTAPPAPVASSGSAADLSVRSWIRIVDSASGISSNGERMSVLSEALTKMPDDDRVVRAWIGAVNQMSSSGARGELLVDFIGTTRLDAERIDWIRNAAASISSSGDRERVLRALADKL